MKTKLVFILGIIFLSGCAKDISKPTNETIENFTIDEPTITDSLEEQDSVFNEITSSVKLGIDVLKDSGFKELKGKNVGLITNQTGVNHNLKSTIDILNESLDVNLKALFGPEHGVRGDVEGGEYVKFYYDPKTKLPVFSLYGRTRKPTAEMLDEIDVLVYDIQDIGVRSYTFISTMGMAMEAASENNLEFVVLDRPNPLGGEKIEGNLIDEEYRSFISQFDIPYVYGLTCGELANLLVGEKMIEVSPKFKPIIIRMENWKRSMIWNETGMEWVPTSPHIPQEVSAIFYPMTGILGELRSSLSIGVGYTLPFQIIGAEWIDSQKLIRQLNKYNINGLIFRPITFQPYYAFGEGKILNGVQIHISDYSKVNLMKTQFYIIDALNKIYPDYNLFDLADSREISMFNKAVGSDEIINMFEDGKELGDILKFLDKDVNSFKDISKKYFLYD